MDSPVVAGVALEPDGSPDWDRIRRTYACSRCGYDLRTLREPRCPECGLQFSWPEYFAAQQSGSDRWFEHQWSKWPVRSWLRTLLAGARPIRFWRRMSIHVPVRMSGLLLAIALASLAPMLAMFAFNMAVSLDASASQARAASGQLWWTDYLSADVADRVERLRGFAEYYWGGAATWWGAWGTPLWQLEHRRVAFWLAVYLLLVLALSSLRQTLHRCRVQPRQMLRVVGLAAIPTALIDSICRIVIYSALAISPYNANYSVLYFLPPAFLAISTIAGLKVYLRVPRAVFVGCVIHAVVLLTILTAIVTWSLGFR